MTWPLKDDFPDGGVVCNVPAEWYNTVAKIFNTITGRNISISKSADPSLSDPWTIELNTDEEGNDFLPPHGAGTDGYVLMSNGTDDASWEHLLTKVLFDALGVGAGDATKAIVVNAAETSFELGTGLPSGTQGDMLWYDTAWTTIGAGSSGQILQSNGAASAPTWVAATAIGGLPSSSGKSQYMVLQLDADSGSATWDWVRAH